MLNVYEVLDGIRIDFPRKYYKASTLFVETFEFDNFVLARIGIININLRATSVDWLHF